MTGPQSATEWFAKSEEHSANAKALVRHGSCNGAYDRLVEAVECAAKGAIMKTEGRNRWPERDERPALYSHNLGDLFAASELRTLIDDSEITPQKTKICYHALRGLTLRRYQQAQIPRKTVEELIKAFTDENHGLLQWLKAR